MMNVRSFAIAGLCVLILTSCEDKTSHSIVEESISTESSTETRVDETEEVDSEPEIAETTEVSEVEATVSDTERMDLYESFLKNDEKVHISKTIPVKYRCDIEKSIEQDCTLGEVIDLITTIDRYDGTTEKIGLDKIKYAYIDCGNDGNKELLININTKDDMEIYEQYVVVKEIDGVLSMIYSDATWPRSYIYFNKYGYIFGNSSGGASHHEFDKSFIDADGNIHYLYHNRDDEIVLGAADISFNGEPQFVPESIQLDGRYAFLTFDFNGTPENDSDDVYTYAKQSGEESRDWSKGYRCYSSFVLLQDDLIYDSSFPLKQFFDTKGLKICTLSEVEQMISEKEASEGLTDEVKNGEDAEWIELDF